MSEPSRSSEELERRASAVSASWSYIDQLYGDFAENPDHVGEGWKGLFSSAEVIKKTGVSASSPEPSTASSLGAPTSLESEARIHQLIRAYRTYGHLEAGFNPIRTDGIGAHTRLSLEGLGFNESELGKLFPSCGLLIKEQAPLSEIIQTLRAIYCDKIGFEYTGLQRPQIEHWIQHYLESSKLNHSLDIQHKRSILRHLNASELFEVFLHTKYPGQKRFSLEGAETLIPIIASLIDDGAEFGLDTFVIGMAHRGRLNVLSNILNKSHESIFYEFEDTHHPEDFFEGSGDVKYHKGFTANITTHSGREVSVELPANPSHLEAINTVVQGIVRAKEVQVGDDVEMQRILPILVHGDAAVAGQGIVYETLQLYDLPGYRVGGTIHLVINNQIGFTTLPKDARSTRYCTDVARAFGAPVFHVNAEDPEGCIYATNLAIQLRQRFHCDVFIEINGWRKYGHNEGDEPAFTQPKEYEIIRSKTHSIRERYRDDLIHQGVLEQKMATEEEQAFKESLQEALSGIREGQAPQNNHTAPSHEEESLDGPLLKDVETKVESERLKNLTERFCSVPEGFSMHSKLKRLLKTRMAAVSQEKEKAAIDWGLAEHLAFASLIDEGVHVRLSGQDSRRGTFSHRHAMWIDQKNADKYFPLSNLSESQGRFDVFNSPLSEYGVLGFEFGYSLERPEALVLWEAQFGDFNNGAQIVIDQFISTSEQKWGKACPLVMLLPHGFEGQGPEHSSARMERFLQLAGDRNMRIVNPTTPAQLFHLFRAQVKCPVKKPLIVFTPKGLLRHPQCVSSLKDFEEGSFQRLIDDPNSPKEAQGLVFCCGRIYYDLIKEREARGNKDLAIVRLEQLYPLDVEGVQEILKAYKKAKRFYWVQEEPLNMGAWDFIRAQIKQLLPGRHYLECIGRDRSASPATGSFRRHKMEYDTIISTLYGEKGASPKKAPQKAKATKG